MIDPSLKETERKHNRDLYYGDGLTWVFKGFAFIMCYLVFEVSLLMCLLPILFIPLNYWIKKKYVSQRRGDAKSRLYWKRSRQRNTAIVFAFLLIMLFLLALFGKGLTEDKAGYFFFGIYLVLFVEWQVRSFMEWDGISWYPLLERVVILGLIIVFAIGNQNFWISLSCSLFMVFSMWSQESGSSLRF
ncbi:MAG: hypothetical protein PHO85_07345 [Candidatus Cloacimonetes bacterium]|nr:hypothetical protein [Candidatus Cloacimonadota bacterium]